MIKRFATHAMATRFELVLEGDSEVVLIAVAEEALEEIRLAEEAWSLFRPGSLLSKVNREAARRPVSLDEATFSLFREALEVSRSSGGAFDPTVAPLMRVHGFHPGAPGETPRWGAEKVLLDEASRSVRFTEPGVALDLGGIAKGYALDLAAELLREHGIERALLHGGTSSVIALGAPPDQAGWRVALGPESEAPVAVLRDAALAVSAPHGRTVLIEGEPRGHVLDPESGEPARGVRLAAVIALAAGLADALSTALCAGGGREPKLPPDVQTLIDLEGESDSWRHRAGSSSPAMAFEFPLSSGLPV